MVSDLHVSIDEVLILASPPILITSGVLSSPLVYSRHLWYTLVTSGVLSSPLVYSRHLWCTLITSQVHFSPLKYFHHLSITLITSGVLSSPLVYSHHFLFRFIFLPDPCCGKSCVKYMKCVVTKERKAVCQCQNIDECPEERDLVCGSDGNTYGNDCLMKATACKEKKLIETVENKKCGKLITKM